MKKIILAASIAMFLPQLATANSSGAKEEVKEEVADYAVGRRAVKAKDWKAAVTALKKAVKNAPDNADIHNDLGHAYRQLGEMDLSFSHYNEALRLNPNHREAHEYIGEAYLKIGKPDKAAEHLEKLETICGKNCEEYRDLARAIAAYKK
jgi:cytochrome c-type biogenesis protein CcmH/NrfG